MKRGIIAIPILVILAVSCRYSNSYVSYYTNLPHISKRSTILLMPMNEGVPKERALDIFYNAQLALRKTNVFLYLPQIEYILIGKGMKKEDLYNPDKFDSIRGALTKEFHLDYIIKADIVDASQGDVFRFLPGQKNCDHDHYYNNYYRSYDNFDRRTYCTVSFTIYDVKDDYSESKFVIEKEYTPSYFPNKSGGTTAINFSSPLGAYRAAFAKGIRILRREIRKDSLN